MRIQSIWRQGLSLVLSGAGYLFSWGLWEYLKHLPADEELLLSVTLQRGGTYLVSEAALSCTTHSYNNAERDLHTCLYHTFTHRTYNLIFMSSWGFSTDSRLSSRQDGATLCLPLENTKLKNIYILDINGCESSSELNLYAHNLQNLLYFRFCWR